MINSLEMSQGILMEVEARFDRLEDKIDKLGAVVIKLVEIDTKMDAFVNHNAIQDKRLDTHSSRIDESQKSIVATNIEVEKVKSSVLLNTRSGRMAERVFFILFTAAVGIAAYALRT